MNPTEFIRKWTPVQLSERSAAQQHFLDLCELLDHPKPAETDPEGVDFTFERGVKRRTGGRGWADVWKREHFAWEYKGRHKDLEAAYRQLLTYREPLESPPLLAVCDLHQIEIYTNFTSRPTEHHHIPLERLGDPESLQKLRWMFFQPYQLEPRRTVETITTTAAARLADVAQSMRRRGLDPHAVAQFLDRVVFCLFAEDISLLPDQVFREVASRGRKDPGRFARMVGQLFAAMAEGGDFGLSTIRHFNGNLFDASPALPLTDDEITAIFAAAELDWGAVDASIFGTLLERGMDPDRRSQLGAHYTSRADIETLIEPVVMQPLRREWEGVRTAFDKTRSQAARRGLIVDFLERLAAVRVLDPACGSGNFLYVTLQHLKDLEKEVIVFAMDQGLPGVLPQVGPWQLFGIEKNPYAHDLAQTTVWIGYLQWVYANGFGVIRDPVLLSLADNFRCMDAILDLSDPDHPREPEWPEVDFIIGNPPFLGNKRMRGELGAEYCDALWNLYRDRLPGMSDLCCYWFEKARAAIQAGRTHQAGLLATTAIKQIGGRRVLERINESAQIFFAVTDRDWVLDGASVRISMVGFGKRDGAQPAVVDGDSAPRVNADLTTGTDLTHNQRLRANMNLCFMGTKKVGAFDVDTPTALALLHDTNPHGRPNSDVLRPYRNGSDLVRLCSRRWIIDFGVSMGVDAAALYEAPFEYLVKYVKPEREGNNDKWRREHWWLLGRTLGAYRQAVGGLSRYLATPCVSKHRLFTWLDTIVLPDGKLIAIAGERDCQMGVIHSRLHEVWTLANCGWHGIGNDANYNPTTCFETFPFPRPTQEQQADIGAAAAALDSLRTNWLNPPEWTCEEFLEFTGAVDGPWARYVQEPDSRGIGTVRYPQVVPKNDACAGFLKNRTLTNLYNQRPSWLDNAHRQLDAAVFAAYGWPADLTDAEILERLLALNRERAAEEASAAISSPHSNPF